MLLVAVAAGFRIGFYRAAWSLFLLAAITNAVIVTPLFFGSASPAAANAGPLQVASVPVQKNQSRRSDDVGH